MRVRSKRLTGLVAIAAASVLVLGACSSNKSGNTNQAQSSAGFASCDSKPNTCNSGPTKKGGTLVAALEKTIQSWNLIDSSGNTYETQQVLDGTVPNLFLFNPDSTVVPNLDILAGEPQVTSQSPMTVVYKINPNAVWSDGQPINADDFTYMWKVDDGKDCPNCEVASTTGYTQIDNVVGSDNGKTVTVTFKQPFPDWKSLFYPLYPAHLATTAGGNLTSPAGLLKLYNYFSNNYPTWSGGPYMISSYQKDVSVTLKPNPKWYGKTKPALDSIVFRMITDQAQETPAMQNKEVQMLTSQPTQDIVTQVQGMQNVNFNLAKGPTWEHIDLNLKNKALADKALRQAIFTAIDRNAIISKTVGPFFKGAAPLNNHNIMVGQPGYQDVITPTGQGAGNIDKAKQILQSAGYKLDGGTLKDKSGQPVPQLRFGFTTGNVLREQTGEVVQQELQQIGLKIKLDPFKSLGQTLAGGDFDMIIYAWVGTPFLAGDKDLWSTNGGSNYGHYSNPQADALMTKAVTESTATAEANDFNQADALMAQDAYSLPLYQKPVFIALYNDYINIRNNPTSEGPGYNMQEWGMKAAQ